MSLVALPGSRTTSPQHPTDQHPTAEHLSAEPPRRTDPGAVRAALGAPSRRAVVRTGVWSVPVVAAAMAAPAFAASPSQCGTCSGGAPPRCIISGSGGTGCTCAPGLVCVGTGPLGLLNVCVGVGPLFSTCGSSTCAGVCLTSGGQLVTAINLVGSLLLALSNNPLCSGAQSQVGFPTDICASPLLSNGQGQLGSICLTATGTGSLAAATLASAITALRGLLNTAGLGPASTCASGYTCRPGFALSASGGACPINGLNVNLGFCRC